ncbi:hypothetical protein M9H77_01890 [Catharanthus roseus]|uniref:Uncharacterized protein n=1 Tax=Catharanthus roseus TaxID=4058 RepID=A0ACC0C6R8_CATRO|nr:hypothetical protein M9H77_01890 [Catharanthus roseus]
MEDRNGMQWKIHFQGFPIAAPPVMESLLFRPYPSDEQFMRFQKHHHPKSTPFLSTPNQRHRSLQPLQYRFVGHFFLVRTQATFITCLFHLS